MTPAELLALLRRVEELGGPVGVVDLPGSDTADWIPARIGDDEAELEWDDDLGLSLMDAWMVIGALVEDARARGIHLDPEHLTSPTILEGSVRAYIQAREAVGE